MTKVSHLNEFTLTKRALKYIKCIEVLWKKNSKLEKENETLRNMMKDYAIQCSKMRKQINSMNEDAIRKNKEMDRIYSMLTKTERYA